MLIARVNEKGRPPMLLFRYKNVDVYFLGFVHGVPPHYMISKKFKKELDKEIKSADIVLAESFSKSNFEKSVGYSFPNPKMRWIPLDSNREIDELVEEIGAEKAIEFFNRIKDAPKEVAKEMIKEYTEEETEKKKLLLKALDGDYTALKKLRDEIPVCHGIECIWDNIRNLQWTRKILRVIHELAKKKKRYKVLVLAGVGHTPIMNYLGDLTWFEKQYNRYYGELDPISKNIIKEILSDKRSDVPTDSTKEH